MRPVVGFQFGENIFDVALYGLLGEPELRGDLFIRIPGGDEAFG